MRSGFKVIDGDGHMQEPLDIWTRYIDREFLDRAPNVNGHVGKSLHSYGPCEAFPDGLPAPRPESVFADFPERYGEAYESWWSLPTRLAHMDEEGIDVMVGFPTNGGLATAPVIADAPLQAALCRAYNDWATEFCADSGGRVQYIAKISMIDVAEGIAEIQRIADRREVAAVVLPPPGAGRLWSGAEFEKLWATLVDHSLAACFHGGDSQVSMFKPWTEGGLAAVSHAISFPVDAMLAMGTMIFGGVLERFPDLRVGFYEANAGWVPWWLARLDDHAAGRQARFTYGDNLRLKPSEYFSRQCSVALDADEGTLESLVAAMGGNNLVFNSDYPHPDAPFPGSVDTFLARNLPQDANRKILWDNPAALYGEHLSNAAVAG